MNKRFSEYWIPRTGVEAAKWRYRSDVFVAVSGFSVLLWVVVLMLGSFTSAHFLIGVGIAIAILDSLALLIGIVCLGRYRHEVSKYFGVTISLFHLPPRWDPEKFESWRKRQVLDRRQVAG